MKKIIFITLISIMLIACPGPDDDFFLNCDKLTIINAEDFANAPNDELVINNLEILENCLIINFSASGCDSETWMFELYDSEEILESNPLQRRLRLSLQKNNDDINECDLYVIKEISFDISNLQVLDSQVVLNIVNSEDQILYEY
jgi:hypothetical protein